MKIKLEKGFKQFLVKTVIFVFLFALMQVVIIPLQKVNMPEEFYPILDTDLGKALLFTAITFILLIRKQVFKLKEFFLS